jgi:excisionase family DNA binding protein
MNLLEDTQLLTVAEVARRLQQSERTVRDKINSGQLPAVKIGTGPRAPIRVDRAELEQWLESSHVTPAERRAPAAGQSTAGSQRGRAERRTNSEP